jgi:hypothetical protein
MSGPSLVCAKTMGQKVGVPHTAGSLPSSEERVTGPYPYSRLNIPVVKSVLATVYIHAVFKY